MERGGVSEDIVLCLKDRLEEHMNRALLGLICGCMLAGCTNRFEDHFIGTRAAPLSSQAEVVVVPLGGDVPPGKLLGRSSFVSTGESSREAQEAARQLGADIVAWEQQYLHSTTSIGTREVSSHAEQTTQTSGTVTSIGSDGIEQSQVSGTSRTTTSETSHVPYTSVEHWYEIKADFYRSNRARWK